MDFNLYWNEKKKDWQNKNRLRSLSLPAGIDFCSNDYLGFCSSVEIQAIWLETLKQDPNGSSGSRLLRGHSEVFEQFERQLALCSGQEAALFFATGYQANLSLLSALLSEKAIVFSDECIHASMIDGIKLSRCEKYIWQHNKLDVLEALLVRQRKKDHMHFVVVESIYSMQGDFAPLKDLVDLCEKYGAYLIVDEAHATGLWGERGSGRVEAENLSHRIFATIHTAGKALGVSGAWVAGSTSLRDFLVNNARPFIYSTAPGYGQLRSVQAALLHWQKVEGSVRELFFSRNAFLESALNPYLSHWNCHLLNSPISPVHSLCLGENSRALKLMSGLAMAGYDVRAIRPPTVPQGQALLRMTVPVLRTEQEILDLVQVLDHHLSGVSC